MDQEQVMEYLNSTPEGQKIIEQITDGIKRNKNEILSEKKGLQAELSSVSQQIGEYQTQIEQLRRDNFQLKADQQIRETLQDYTLLPGMEKVLTKLPLYEDQAEIDDNGVLQVSGKPIGEYYREFFSTEDGKSYIQAPQTVGAGAKGNMHSPVHNRNYSGMSSEQIIKSATKN